MTLQTIMESLAAQTMHKGYDEIDKVISVGRPQLFSFQYPYFDDTLRENFETKFIKNFYFNEIGFETYGRFKLSLESRLNMIMPHFMYLYENSKNYDLFDDVKLFKNLVDKNTNDLQYTHNNDTINNVTNNTTTDETFNSEGDNFGTNDTNENQDSTTNVKSTANTTENTIEKISEYPQSKLSDFLDNKYLSNLKQTDRTLNTDTNTDSTGNANRILNSIDHTINTLKNTNNLTNKQLVDTVNNNQMTKHEFATINNNQDIIIKGKNGGKSYIQLLYEYGELVSNLDKQIIDDLFILFMGVGFYE